MKKLILLLIFISIYFSSRTVFASLLIDDSNITVFGTVFNGHIPAHTSDDDLGTFWHGTNVQIGESNYLAYKFKQPYDIFEMEFITGFFNAYYLGEMDIQKSNDSTNGVDGNWITLIEDYYNENVGDDERFSIITDFKSIQWIRLQMTYEGRGANGSDNSKSFYLNELNFYGENAVATTVPESSTMLLLLTGLFGLMFVRGDRK